MLLAGLCMSGSVHAQDWTRPEVPLSLQYVEVGGDSWSQVKWQIWHSGVRGRDGRAWPALTVFSPGLTCRNDFLEARPQLSMSLPRRSRGSQWAPSVAFKFWQLRSVLRRHEFGHVRIYRAGVPSCLRKMPMEPCEDAVQQFQECMSHVMALQAEYEEGDLIRLGSI
jgi:hypothetical protein